jgi:hypothetical protein
MLANPFEKRNYTTDKTAKSQREIATPANIEK